MSQDDRIEVQFGADTSQLDAAAQKAAADVQKFGDTTSQAGQKSSSAWSNLGNVFKSIADTVSGSMGKVAEGAEAAASSLGSAKGKLNEVGEAFEKIQAPLLAFAAIAAGGAFFKEAISESNALTGEVLKLGRTLGISSEEASILRTALDDIYVDSDTYTDAFSKFAMQLRRNEEGMTEMGLKTRDANGHLRDSNTLFREALAVVGQYKPGLDQQTAAMTLFGRSVDDVMKLQKLNNEVLDDAKQKNEELGLTITQGNVESMKAYKAAMNDVGDVFTAIKKVVGDAVMPVFTSLGNYFASDGPNFVAIFRGALTGLLLVFRVIEMAVKDVTAFIAELINTAIDQIGNLADIISNALSGNWDGVLSSAKAFRQRFVQGFSNLGNEVVDNWKGATDSFAGDLDRIWSKGEAVQGKKPGNKTMGAFGTPTAQKTERTPSYMATYEAELAEQKLLYEKQNGLRQMSKEEELTYWRDILSTYQVTSKDQVQIVKKTAELELQVMREKAKRAQELKKEEIDAIEQEALDGVQMEENAAQLQVATYGMTNQQLLELQRQFENRRYEIQAMAQAERIALLQQDPNADPVALQTQQDKLLEITRQYQLKKQQLDLQGAQQSMQVWQDLSSRMSSLWDKGVEAMMNGTLRWRNALKAVGTEAVGWFANSVVKPMAAQWLIGEETKTAATSIGERLRMALGLQGAATTTAAKASEATAVVSANAAEAASGAASSQASIPYVGPILAIAAMGAILAAVSGLTGGIKSAAGGFDIPSGTNPVTQLHEEEMVLPKGIANPLRKMLAGGGAGAESSGESAQGNSMAVHYHDYSGGKLTDADINRNAVKIAKALNRVHRDGWRPA
jgi:hypothetical protein